MINENKLGGRGKCQYCGEWDNNVSYHEAHCCPKYSGNINTGYVNLGLKFNCFKCDDELKESGAILFSPPIMNICMKYHLCEKCFKNIIDYINTLKDITID